MTLRQLLAALLTASLCTLASAQTDRARNLSETIKQGPLPLRVHVFEDYETQIEKRWWLRGEPIEEGLAESLSKSVPNRRACRASETKDFDRKMGDQSKTYKGVIFNPVPGPPMGGNTRLSFRYWLKGTDTLRVQIFSLSKGYHRYLVLEDLPQEKWRAATVDMTKARRPDGSGGALSKDERIDDIQFYVAPEAELLIDDIVLYEAAAESEKRAFPRRVIFTGWFDTGKQGKEWPGDFRIVRHEEPRGWDYAESVVKNGEPVLKVNLRGRRALSETTRVRFLYHVEKAGPLRVLLSDRKSGFRTEARIAKPKRNAWSEAVVDFEIEKRGATANSLTLEPPEGATLKIDDLLIYEPR